MNKKGDGAELLRYNIIFFALEALVFIIMFVWIVGFQDNIALKEDFYSKELTRIIDSAVEGKEASFLVTELVEQADSNKVQRSDIFTFDNVNNRVTVKLSPRSGTSFGFFKDVNVIYLGIEPGTEEDKGPLTGDVSDELFVKFIVAESEEPQNE